MSPQNRIEQLARAVVAKRRQEQRLSERLSEARRATKVALQELAEAAEQDKK